MVYSNGENAIERLSGKCGPLVAPTNRRAVSIDMRGFEKGCGSGEHGTGATPPMASAAEEAAAGCSNRRRNEEDEEVDGEGEVEEIERDGEVGTVEEIGSDGEVEESDAMGPRDGRAEALPDFGSECRRASGPAKLPREASWAGAARRLRCPECR